MEQLIYNVDCKIILPDQHLGTIYKSFVSTQLDYGDIIYNRVLIIYFTKN